MIYEESDGTEVLGMTVDGCFDIDLPCNLKEGYQLLREERNNRYALWNAADMKLNMILVFDSAMWLVFAQLLSSVTWTGASCLIRFLLVGYCIFNVASIVLILIGLCPTGLHRLDAALLVFTSTYDCSSEDYFTEQMLKLEDEINVLDKKLQNKHIFLFVALILSVVSVLMLAGVALSK